MLIFVVTYLVTGIARSVSPGQHVRYMMYSPNNQVVSSGKLTESIQHTISTPVT